MVGYDEVRHERCVGSAFSLTAASHYLDQTSTPDMESVATNYRFGREPADRGETNESDAPESGPRLDA